MSKKIVALILILPLVLMMSLFTAVNSVSLSVSVPVERIEIRGDKFVSLDIDKQERYYVDYVIYPTAAVNKKVNVSVERVGTQQLAQIEYRDGYIYPKQAGVANVSITTADGGFRDSFHVVVKETKLKQIICSAEKNYLSIGETMQINTEFVPATAVNKMVEYISTDNEVLAVDDDGLIIAKAKGTAIVIVRSLADSTISASLEISVVAQELFSLPVTQTNTSLDGGAVNMTVETDQEFSLSYGVYDLQDHLLDGVIEAVNSQEQFTDLGNGNYKFEYKFTDHSFIGTAVIKFTLTMQDQTIDRTFTITRIEGLDAQFKSQDDIYYAEIGKAFNWKNQITVSESSVEYSVNYSNDNLSVGSLTYIAQANKMGVTKATITIENTKNPTQTVTLEKDVYIYPEIINIEKVPNSAGIENVLTIGKYNAKGEQVKHHLPLSFGGDAEGAGFDKIKEKIVFETNETEVAVENGTIKILDDDFKGIVGITAKLSVGSTQKVSQTINVRCVGAGVEVDNFVDLHWATKNNKVIVLTKDIINDFGKDSQGHNFYQGDNVDRIESTYDTKYYQNMGNSNTKVVTLLQFRADLYGNGYIINADNVTNTSSTGGYNSDSLFKGPLNLVAMSESGASVVSVKAQDNICFAVYENTTINNVQLKGRTLKSSESENTYNLTDLDYAGTVVEVLGDNVNIEYSRINNGRTVLRAFGDIDDANKDIHLNVKNCVLSLAREFIVRIGSNLIVRDTNALTDAENYQAPYLEDNYEIEFPAQEQYKAYGDEQDKSDYEQKYIRTFVNIENSVLKDSGIFCIGMDSHFAGPMLVDGAQVLSLSEQLGGWKGISGTSYGAKLTFSGDVRLYDWKRIDNIDSSTLIENNAPDVYPYNKLKLNINEMIECLDNTSMVYCDQQGVKYVHGGIVFFGGGKNYSVFEDNSQSFTGLLGQGTSVQFADYKISLKEVGMGFLEMASGDKPFYFSLYNASSTFNPQMQKTILSDGNADNCIYFNA